MAHPHAHFLPNDRQMFYKYLDKANSYFEFGAGGSTYQAYIRKNIKHIYSVESDKLWHDKVKAQCPDKKKATHILIDFKPLPNTWGHPTSTTPKHVQQRYSNVIIDLKVSPIDLLLIDGRFRTACCLKSLQVIDEKSILIFDDFFPRKEYHIVLNWFEIIDSTNNKNMVVLKKKKNVLPPSNRVLSRYEFLAL